MAGAIASRVSGLSVVTSKSSGAKKWKLFSSGQKASGHLPLIRTDGRTDKCKIHPKTTAKRLLFILILLLQTQSFIQALVLLRCGDIESNPGPGLYPDLDYDDIDNTTVLIEDDLCDVLRDAVNIQATYYHFGAELGLPPRDLDAIRIQYVGDVPQCFSEVLLAWLRHRYNVDRHGLPTWRRLVEAVDTPSGGNNHALAKTIASKHPAYLITRGNLQAYEKNHELNSQDGDVCINGASRNLIQRCRDTMAAYYLRHFDDHAWPPVKVTNFINLAVVKDQTSWRKTVQKSVDDIIGDKNHTSYSSMLSNIEESRFILLEGRPGCGKTTLLNKISRDWSNGEILKSKLVIFVPLRRLNNEPNRKLSTLIRVACPTLPGVDRKQLVSYIEKAQGKNVTFAFDGLDEYRSIHYRENRLKCFFTRRKAIEREDVFDILRAEKLPKAVVILTSRPVASKNFRRCAGKRLEVLGFQQPQIKQYINHYFHNDKRKAQQLIAHLEHHPNIMNMAYLPLHCAMLVFLYEEDVPLPETETEFYRHFTLSTLVRSLHRRKVLKDDFRLSSFTDIPRGEKHLFDDVCQLAFDATINSKQVFKRSELKHKLFNVGGILPGESTLDLVVTDHCFVTYGVDQTYTFLHLTFQEYLAAIHIAGLNEGQRRAVIKAHGNAARLSVLWRFLCGMIDYSKHNEMNTFKRLMEMCSDLLFKVQCCYESQHSSTCAHIIEHLCGKLEFKSIILSASDCTAIGYVVKNNPGHVCIVFDECNISFEGASSLLRYIGRHRFSLTLRGGSATVSCLECLSQYQFPCQLICLSLSKSGITENEAKLLGEGLKQCIALQELDLSHNNIGQAGASAIGEGLTHCVHLENLNLSDNNIGDEGALAIFECLKHSLDLQYLSFRSTKIGGAAVQALARDLKCTKLRELNIHENYLLPDAVRHLVEIVTTFKSLQTLRVDVPREDADELIEAVGQAPHSIELLLPLRPRTRHFSKRLY